MTQMPLQRNPARSFPRSSIDPKPTSRHHAHNTVAQRLVGSKASLLSFSVACSERHMPFLLSQFGRRILTPPFSIIVIRRSLRESLLAPTYLVSTYISVRVVPRAIAIRVTDRVVIWGLMTKVTGAVPIALIAHEEVSRLGAGRSAYVVVFAGAFNDEFLAVGGYTGISYVFFAGHYWWWCDDGQEKGVLRRDRGEVATKERGRREAGVKT